MSQETSLSRKTFLATLWTVGSRMLVRVIGVISLIILAKILGPEDYGLVGKAVLIQSFLYLITELGLESALITNQKATKDHYSTAWTIHILRGAFLGVLLAALAYPTSLMMDDPRIENIVYCLALITFVESFYNIYVVDFRKNLTFSYDFYYSLYSKIGGFVTTLTVAYIWETYWALIAGSAANMLVRLVSSYLMTKGRPTLSLAQFSSLFNFSKWVMMNEIIKAVLFKIDGFLLSVYSTTANVGLYSISSEIAATPSTELAMPVARACTPSFAKLNHDLEAFAKFYVATLSVLLTITIPAATGVSILAEPIVLTMLDEKWVGAIPVIEIFALYGLCHASVPIYISAALALNRPDILTLRSAISVVYTVIIVFFSLKYYGFMGLVWGSLFCSVISVIIAQAIMVKIKVLSLSSLASKIWRVILAATAMLTVLHFMKKIDFAALEGLMLIELLLYVFVGALTYSVTLTLLWIISGKPEGPEKSILGTLLKGRFGTA